MANGDSDSDPRTHIGHVLTDYRDGLLDSHEDAVDAIMEHPRIAAALKLFDEYERHNPTHSIKTRG